MGCEMVGEGMRGWLSEVLTPQRPAQGVQLTGLFYRKKRETSPGALRVRLHLWGVVNPKTTSQGFDQRRIARGCPKMTPDTTKPEDFFFFHSGECN